MNNIITKIFTLLLLLYTGYINAQELIITVPKEFSQSSLPLPKFPEATLNSLPENNLYNRALEKGDVRYIPQNSIKYFHYLNILNFNLNNTIYFSNSINFTDLKPGLYMTYFDNFNKVGIGSSGFEILNITLPVKIGMLGSLKKNEFKIITGYRDYNWDVDYSYGILNSNPFVHFDYLNRGYITSVGKLNYNDKLDLLIGAGRKWDSFQFKLGLIYSGSFYPYINMSFVYNNLNIIMKSEILDTPLYNLSINYLDYTIYIEYDLISMFYGISVGFNGFNIDVNTDFKTVNTAFFFINNKIESIISLSIDSSFNIDFSLTLGDFSL